MKDLINDLKGDKDEEVSSDNVMLSLSVGSFLLSKSSVQTDESGKSDWFELSMSQKVGRTVTVELSLSDLAEATFTVDGAEVSKIVFTETDWNKSRRVTITGNDDSKIDGDRHYTLKMTATIQGSVGNKIELTIFGLNYDNDKGAKCKSNSLAKKWYKDEDGDGLGDPSDSESVFTCDTSTPSGYVDNKDDTAPNCATNNIDECDVCGGSGKHTWYKDEDKDGVGDINQSIVSCDKPSDDYTLQIEDYSIISAPAASVSFGQSFQYQIVTNASSAYNISYSLSNHPTNMSISNLGLVEWTPNNSSDINTFNDIKIKVSLSDTVDLTQTFNLEVKGTCTSGKVLGIWSGDQRTSIDNTKYLGNITNYSGSKSAKDNYGYSSHSVNLTVGPTPTDNNGTVFFYESSAVPSDLYFFFFFSKEDSSETNWVNVYWDIYTENIYSDKVVVADDKASELNRHSQSQSSGTYSSEYKARFKYKQNSDGGVIGPFKGEDFKVYVKMKERSSLDSNTLTLGTLDSVSYYSKNNSIIALKDKSDFTIRYKTTTTCSSP